MPDTTIAATTRSDGSASLQVDGRDETLPTTRSEDARREIVERAARRAAMLGAPVRVTITEPDGASRLVVAADGSVTDAEEAPIASGTDATAAAPAAASTFRLALQFPTFAHANRMRMCQRL